MQFPSQYFLKLILMLYYSGQLFTLGKPSDIPAEDFVAAEDIVFVSVSYRCCIYKYGSLVITHR